MEYPQLEQQAQPLSKEAKERFILALSEGLGHAIPQFIFMLLGIVGSMMVTRHMQSRNDDKQRE